MHTILQFRSLKTLPMVIYCVQSRNKDMSGADKDSNESEELLMDIFDPILKYAKIIVRLNSDKYVSSNP